MENKHLEDGMARLLMEIDAEDALGHDDSEDFEAFEALSFGTASADEVESLGAQARDDADIARRVAAFRPLGDDAKSRLMAGVQAQLSGPSRGPRAVASPPRRSEEPATAPTSTATSGAQPAARSANDNRRQTGRREGAGGAEPADDGQADAPSDPAGAVIPFTRTARRRWLPQAIAAVAAVLLCVVLWPRPPGPLPVYQLSAESTTRKMRSEPAPTASEVAVVGDVLALADGDTFEIVLRPQSAVSGSVDAAVYALRGAGLERTALPAEVSESGSVRVRGRFDAALRGAGDNVELWVVVSAAGAVPGPEELDPGASIGDGEGQKWRVLRLILEGDPKGVL
ncbi:MAG: hypothetical protein AAFY88_17380 [Acidobacteriota bacterium]